MGPGDGGVPGGHWAIVEDRQCRGFMSIGGWGRGGSYRAIVVGVGVIGVEETDGLVGPGKWMHASEVGGHVAGR